MNSSPPFRTTVGSGIDRFCYWLIAAGLVIVTIRVFTLRSSTGETPFLSANDRSRWQAMAALVHEQTSIVDRPQAHRDPVTQRKTLQSIDRVMHAGPDGQLHSYSSKPPLLVCLYALPYAVVHIISGQSVYTQPMFVGQWTIAVAHLIPLAIYWWFLLTLINNNAMTATTKYVLSIATVFGTPLIAFATTVNNHLPGAIMVLATVVAMQHIARERTSWYWFTIAGLAAGLAGVSELPALAWAAAVGFLFILRCPWRGTAIYGLTLGAIGVISLVSNWWAHGSWRPPYAHRNVGATLAVLPSGADAESAFPMPALVTRPSVAIPLGPERTAVSRWASENFPSGAVANVLASLRSDHWELRATDPTTKAIVGRIALVPKALQSWEARVWDDWYDYPGTYWTKANMKGVDQGEPQRWIYGFHMLLGHHGVFSLTPIWICALFGACYWLADADRSNRELTIAIASVTLICIVFYLSRPLADRNYGGVSCCFRWLLWFTPLWIWLAIPAIDRWSATWSGRGMVWIFLALSCLTVALSHANPWSHPWLYRPS